MAVSTLDERSLRDLLSKYRGQRGVILDCVHDALHAQGYISPKAMVIISEVLNMPVAEVYGVITYYSEIPLEPPAGLTIRLCVGPACRIRGMPLIQARMEAELGIEMGRRTADNKVALEPQQCPGICHLAPVSWVNGIPRGSLSISGVRDFLSSIGAI